MTNKEYWEEKTYAIELNQPMGDGIAGITTFTAKSEEEYQRRLIRCLVSSIAVQTIFMNEATAKELLKKLKQELTKNERS